MRTIIILIIYTAVISLMADGARNLGFFIMPIERHQRFVQSLLKELAARKPEIIKYTSLPLEEYACKLKIVKKMDYSSTMKRIMGLQEDGKDKNPGLIVIEENGLRNLLNIVGFREPETKKSEWTFQQNDFKQVIESDRTIIFLATPNCHEPFITLRYRFNKSDITFHSSSNKCWAHNDHRNSHDTSYIEGNSMVLYLTHGGLLSLNESLNEILESGMPAVGTLLTRDQTKNMNHLEQNGYRFRLKTTNFTAGTLSWTIDETLGNPKYREYVKKSSQILRDKSKTTLETAVNWIEYVIRHKGAHHLKPAIDTMPWYQQAMIDVYLTIALIVLIPVYIFVKLLKILFSLCNCNIKQNNTED